MALNHSCIGNSSVSPAEFEVLVHNQRFFLVEFNLFLQNLKTVFKLRRLLEESIGGGGGGRLLLLADVICVCALICVLETDGASLIMKISSPSTELSKCLVQTQM